MKILLLYPGPTYSTFDVARGYHRALQALGEQVVTFDYHNTITFYREALRRWQELNSGFVGSEQDVTLLASERVVIEAMNARPDVVLIVSGLQLHKRAFDLLWALGLPTVVLLTESPYLDETHALMLAHGHVAAALTNERHSVQPLSATGVPVTYLPHAYDPARHSPQPVNESQAYDVFFQGTLWPERQALFADLTDLPGKVRLGGIAPAQAVDISAVVDNDLLPGYYSNAKINLNHHRTCQSYDDEVRHIAPGAAWSLGPRAFEIAACGGFQLCDDTRGELRAVFGDSVPTYDPAATGDLRAKIAYWLARPNERAQHAETARRAVQDCTFQNRAQEFLLPVLREVV